MEKTKKCILLVRVSTDRQSFDAQMNELYDLAQKQGYPEANITAVSEKESGIKLDEVERKGLVRLKELVETGEYDCVFAWEISRIARRKAILFSITEYLIKHKVQLIIKEPFISLLNPDGSINEAADTIFTLYAQISESEMRNKKARFQRARAEGFAKGKFEGGRVTLGYRVNENGMWEIDPEDSKLIRLIFDLYNSGQYNLTQLAKELLSRGYFYKKYPIKDRGVQLSITNVKCRIWQILRSTKYLGGEQNIDVSGKEKKNGNIYPQLIDQETWDKCAERRKENRIKLTRHKKNDYLLLQLIHCVCGSAYSSVLMDGCYACRVKHNGIEKGIVHSPNISINVIESLAWYVALQELQRDHNRNSQEKMAKNLEEIEVLRERIKNANEQLDKIDKKRKRLDHEYYVSMSRSEESYDELTKAQNELTVEVRKNIQNYTARIDYLLAQNSNTESMDEVFSTLKGQFETLKNGTEIEVMQTIIREYIKNISVQYMEGKPPMNWKIVTFQLHQEESRLAMVEELRSRGLNSVADTFGTTFYVDTVHKVAYWDKETTNPVPMVVFDRIKKTRIEQRKNRKRKKKQKE